VLLLSPVLSLRASRWKLRRLGTGAYAEGALVRAVELDAGTTHPTHLLTVAIDAIVHINRS
jgi:hypothetical protein